MTDKEPKQAPRMTIFAGPNGSGKSTVVDALKAADGFPQFINADVIAAEELSHIRDNDERNRQAANIAEARRQEALERGESFAYESVFSTVGRVQLIDEAKKRGYVVDLVFVTTSDPAINVVRVEERAASGGHPVTEEKVRERYARAMELLPVAFLRVDGAQVFDNSKDLEFPQLVATKHVDQIQYMSNPPDWVAQRLIEPVSRRQLSKNAFVQQAQAISPDAVVEDASISGGPTYSGVIVGLNQVQALQKLAGAKGKFVIHDLALTGGWTMTEGKATAVSYVFGPDGKHLRPQSQLRTVTRSR